MFPFSPFIVTFDSVRLSYDVTLTPHFLEHGYKEWKVKQRRSNVCPALWGSGDAAVHAKEATLTRDGLSFRLSRPDPRSRQLKCSAWASVPKGVCGHNARPVLPYALLSMADKAVTSLRTLGILANAEDTQVVELHLCRDVPVAEGWEFYEPILRAMCPPNSNLFHNEATYILRGSTHNSWAVYAKHREIRNSLQASQKREVQNFWRESLGDVSDEVPILRFEWRLRKAQKIRKEFGTDSPFALVRHFHKVALIFEDALQSSLFYWKTSKLQERQTWDKEAEEEAQILTRRNSNKKTKKNVPKKLMPVRLPVGRGDIRTRAAFEWYESEARRCGVELAQLLRLLIPDAAKRSREMTQLHAVRRSQKLPCGLYWDEVYEQLFHIVVERRFAPDGEEFASSWADVCLHSTRSLIWSMLINQLNPSHLRVTGKRQTEIVELNVAATPVEVATLPPDWDFTGSRLPVTNKWPLPWLASELKDGTNTGSEVECEVECLDPAPLKTNL